MKKLSFPKSKRLISNKQLKSVLSNKVYVNNNILILYVSKNECGHPRLGISVSKSYDRAVGRNRIKRLIREVFRQCQYQIPANYDYLILVPSHRPKKNCLPEGKLEGNLTGHIRSITLEDIRKSFLGLVNKLIRSKMIV